MKTATRIFYRAVGRGVVGAVCVLLTHGATAEQRSGEAIVLGQSGKASARYPVGSVHDGSTAQAELFQGASVGELTRITTGDSGHLCLVLTPGALVHVEPNTDLTIEEMRHTADGLPTRESDLVRRITLNMTKGRLYVDGGVPMASLDLRVRTGAGEVDAHGAVFSVAGEQENDRWSVVSEEYELGLASGSGERVHLESGSGAVLSPTQVAIDPTLRDSVQHQFDFCQGFFRDMEQFRTPLGSYDRDGVAQYIGGDAGVTFLGDAGAVADVSPSFRRPTAELGGAVTPASVGAPGSRRWPEERIWSWWQSIGVIRGVNYVPRTAVNSTEMWMADAFDPETIDEELGWAQNAGYTSVRVPLQEVVWRDDPEGLLDRMDAFLRLASRHGLTVVPVLFDDLNRAGREAEVGPQPEPVPGKNNSRWTPNPGPSRVKDRGAWAELEQYTRAVVGRFKRDKRILYWDLYNTAGNDGLWEQTLPLMDQVFNWVRDINPRQPLSVAAWKEFGTPMVARKLERSDLLSFQSFENASTIESKIQLLKRYKRPIVLCDWLMRQRGNTFQTVLPVCSKHGVGWFQYGLVQGKTQTWLQEEAFRSETSPDVWQHDIMRADGTPYDQEEIDLIQGFQYAEGSGQ